jgi:hypothetical protein
MHYELYGKNELMVPQRVYDNAVPGDPAFSPDPAKANVCLVFDFVDSNGTADVQHNPLQMAYDSINFVYNNQLVSLNLDDSEQQLYGPSKDEYFSYDKFLQVVQNALKTQAPGLDIHAALGNAFTNPYGIEGRSLILYSNSNNLSMLPYEKSSLNKGAELVNNEAKAHIEGNAVVLEAMTWHGDESYPWHWKNFTGLNLTVDGADETVTFMGEGEGMASERTETYDTILQKLQTVFDSQLPGKGITVSKGDLYLSPQSTNAGEVTDYKLNYQIVLSSNGHKLGLQYEDNSPYSFTWEGPADYAYVHEETIQAVGITPNALAMSAEGAA